jgi:hypothetical protein
VVEYPKVFSHVGLSCFERWEGILYGLILLIIVIFLLFGALARWGYGPTGGFGLVVLILLVLLLLGYIPRGF